MRKVVSESQHREYLDGLIKAVRTCDSTRLTEIIRILRPQIEEMLDVLLVSQNNELYGEYFKKFSELGFNFQSLPKDNTPAVSA